MVMIVFAALTAGKTMSLSLLLDWQTIRGDITDGYMYALVWMLNSAIGSVDSCRWIGLY